MKDLQKMIDGVDKLNEKELPPNLEGHRVRGMDTLSKEFIEGMVVWYDGEENERTAGLTVLPDSRCGTYYLRHFSDIELV